MELDLSSDIKWLKRLEKQFNATESYVERHTLLTVIKGMAKRLGEEMDHLSTAIENRACQEIKDKIIEKERG
jgi:hypothetical protein